MITHGWSLNTLVMDYSTYYSIPGICYNRASVHHLFPSINSIIYLERRKVFRVVTWFEKKKEQKQK
jgi:hypothetical protein